MAVPFSPAMVTAPVDDLMEVSTDMNKETIGASDDIDIDIDIEGEAYGGNEDENMGEGEVSVPCKDDDEMADGDLPEEDEMIDDVIDYDHKEDEILSANDEELCDAEDVDAQKGYAPEFDSTLFTTETASAEIKHRSIMQETEQPVEEATAVDGSFTGQVEQGIQDDHSVNDGLEAHKAESQKQASTITEGDELTFKLETAEQASKGQQEQQLGASSREESEAAPYSLAQQENSSDNKEDTSGQVFDQLASDPLESKLLQEGSQELTEVAVGATVGSDAEKVVSSESTTLLQDDSKTEAAEHHTDIAVNASADDGNDFHYQAIVKCQESDMALFPPSHGESETKTYLLSDETLARGTLKAMLQSCRTVLGETVEESEELKLSIPSLGLKYSESLEASSEVSLAQLVDLYLQLQHNDGIENPEPLYLLLEMRQKMSYRLQALYEALNGGHGLSSISTQLDSSGSASEQLEEQPTLYENTEENLVSKHGWHINQEDMAPLEHSIYGAEEDYEPGTPNDAPSQSESSGLDHFDFNSPRHTQRVNRVAGFPSVADSLNNQASAFRAPRAGLAPDAIDSHSTEEGNIIIDKASTEDSLDSLSDTTAIVEPAVYLNTESSEELEDSHPTTNSYSDSYQTEGGNPSDSTHLQQTHFGEDEAADPPLPPELEDDLDDFDDSLEPQGLESSGAVSSVTIVNDTTSTSTIQGDQPEKASENEEANDEITYEDNDDIESIIVPPLEDESNTVIGSTSSTSPGSLKRQRSAVGGDEADNLDPSLQPQPDAKRIRSNEEP
ncbi:MAG: hypothetical protein MMC23_000733 [Stictis urceolatum]|nr:hypothetical protein [Stictis urceolata]